MEEKQKQFVNKSFKTDEDLLPLKKEIDELNASWASQAREWKSDDIVHMSN